MKSSLASEISPSDSSPKQGDLNHQTTPVRPRRKTSRKNLSSDVHSTCSTPKRLQSTLPNSYWNSPSDSVPYSQETRPDVYWDYTSPKLPKGTKKKEIKITVDEFLKSLSQHQVPECKSQSSHYIKLLEKWMTKQNSPVCVKQTSRISKRDNKQRSRRVIEEIKLFMESIQSKNENLHSETSLQGNAEKINSPKANASNYQNISLDKKSFLDGDSTENDSTDDLWGDIDNSFIIKATQQLDVCSNIDGFEKNADIISTIPETITNSSEEFKANFGEICLEGNIGITDPDYHAQLLLSQIIDYDWDSTSDLDDWDKGFIEEDEALSLIPDEVLCGSDTINSPNSNKINDNTVVNDVSLQSIKTIVSTAEPDFKSSSKIPPRDCLVFKNINTNKEVSTSELFDNFGDDSFGEDEAILCKPEVLSWIDEIENKLSQSQKCTPEEIKKKKNEAIQRRKKAKS